MEHFFYVFSKVIIITFLVSAWLVTLLVTLKSNALLF